MASLNFSCLPPLYTTEYHLFDCFPPLTAPCYLFSISFFPFSLKPQPLLQPHVPHQLSGSRSAPGCRCARGLLVPIHVPGGLLLCPARCLRPLLLASPRHPLRLVLPLHPAEVWGRPRARGATTVLHHGGVLHDGPRGNVLAPRRRGGFAGRENRPPGHTDQTAQHQAESRHRRHGTHQGAVDFSGSWGGEGIF